MFYRNSIYNILGQLSVMLVSIISAKFIFSDLGGNELGIVYFGLFLQLAFTELLTLGIAPSITREVARTNDNDSDYTKDLLQCSAMLLWVLYLFVCSILYFSFPWIVALWLNLDGLNPAVAVESLRILLIGGLLSIPCIAFVASLEGAQKMLYANLVTTSAAIVKNVGILIILWYQGSFLTVVTWISLSALLQALILLAFVTKFFRPLFFVPQFHLHIIRNNWIYGLRMSSVSIAAFINVQVERLVVTKFFAVAVLGYYSFVLSLVQGLSIVAGSLSKAAYPVFVALHKEGERSGINNKYDLWQELILLPAIPLVFLVIFFNQIFLSFIFDETISAQIEMLTYWLCLGVFLQITCYLPHTLAVSCGHEKIVVHLGWYNVVISCSGAYFGIKYFGLSGAGIGFVAARFFVVLYAIPKISSSILGRSWTVWLYSMLRLVAAGLCSFGLLLILIRVGALGPLSVFIYYLVGLILYCIFAWSLSNQLVKGFLKNIYLGVKVKI